jgi:hypothetical protein
MALLLRPVAVSYSAAPAVPTLAPSSASHAAPSERHPPSQTEAATEEERAGAPAGYDASESYSSDTSDAEASEFASASTSAASSDFTPLWPAVIAAAEAAGGARRGERMPLAHRRVRARAPETLRAAAALRPPVLVPFAEQADRTTRPVCDPSDVVDLPRAQFELPGMAGDSAPCQYIQVVDLLPEHMPPIDHDHDDDDDADDVAGGGVAEAGAVGVVGTAGTGAEEGRGGAAAEFGDEGWRHTPPAEWDGRSAAQVVEDERDAEVGARLTALQRAMERLESEADNLERELSAASDAAVT